jgi:hypothetical protein
MVYTDTRFKRLVFLHYGYGCFLDGHWIEILRRFLIIEAFGVCRGKLSVENFVLTNLALEPVTAVLEDTHCKSRRCVQGTWATFSFSI